MGRSLKFEDSSLKPAAPKGQPVKAGWNPGDATQRPLCPERAHGQGAWGHRSPRWGEVSWVWADPRFRSAPPLAVAVRRVAARTGARCMSGDAFQQAQDDLPMKALRAAPPIPEGFQQIAGSRSAPRVQVEKDNNPGGVEASVAFAPVPEYGFHQKWQ
jgi:hypothetical protein